MRLVAILFLTWSALQGADRYWIASSAGLWNDSANWSTTSGGAGNAPVPTTNEVVYFNSGGTGNCTVNVAASAGSLNLNGGFTGVLAFGANTVTVAGDADLRSGAVTTVNFFNALYSGSRNDHPGNVGYEFTPTSSLSIVALGRPVSGTMLSNHPIRIWRVSDQSIVASTTVTPASPVDALGYKYELLVSPVTLQSGTAYRISSLEVSGGDAWFDVGDISNHSGVATVSTAAWSTGDTYPVNGGSGANSAYVAPAFYVGALAFSGTSGGLVLSANGTLTPPVTGTIPNLTISGGTTTLATNDLSVAGNLTISSGNLTANGRAISVAGNWSNPVGASGFSAGVGTVTLNGAGGSTQVISGNTTFDSLSATCTTARTLNFTAGTTQVVGGVLSLNGASGQLLSLRSTASPSVWNITASGTRSCSFVNVMDGANISGPAIDPATSTNSGNTTLWFTMGNRYWTPSRVPLLDRLSAPSAAAYGLRTLRAAYTGPLVQVRRSSDNNVQDISADGSGALDLVALATFVGSNSAYVSIWYDQSVGGFNAVQATQNNQPRLVNAGTVELLGGKPALHFSGPPITLATASVPVATYPISLYAVAEVAGATNGAFIKLGASDGIGMGVGSTDFNTSGLNFIGLKENVQWDPSSHVLSAGAPALLGYLAPGSGASTFLFNSASSSGVGSSPLVPTTEMNIGGYGARSPDCTIAEALVFGSALDATDRQALFGRQAGYFAGTAYTAPTDATSWSDSANWSTTSGGSGGAGVPTTGDNVYFDGNGLGTCNVDVAGNVASVTMAAGYTSTVTFATNTLTVVGNADLRSGGTFTGTSGGLVLSATSTLTPPAAATIPNLTISGGTTTLAVNDLNVDNRLNLAGALAFGGRNVSVGALTVSGTANLTVPSGRTMTVTGAHEADYDSALELYWPGDEGSGTVINDRSGHGRNAAFPQATYVAGRYGNAMSCAAGVVATASPTPSSSGDFSVSWWANTPALSNYNADVGWGWNNWLFHTSSNGTVYCGVDIGTRFAVATQMIAGTWQHWVYSMSGGTATLYRDGTVIASGAQTASLGTGSFSVGDGCAFDEVRVWSRAISAAEVQAMSGDVKSLRLTTSAGLTVQGTLSLGGAYHEVDGTWSNASGSSVIITGRSDDLTVPLPAVAYHHLTLNNSGTTFTHLSPLVVAGDLSINAGTLASTSTEITDVKGNWPTRFGADGALIASDTAVNPSYASVTITGAITYAWAGSTADVRAPVKTANWNDRIPSTWYQGGGVPFTVDIAITDGQSHLVSLYCLDWDYGSRAQTVVWTAVPSGTVLFTDVMSGYEGGAYLSHTVSGQVRITLTGTGGSGAQANVSGIFFGGSHPLSAATVSVAGNVAIGGGNLTLVNSATISVAGNWSNSGGAGGFSAGSGTVRLSGAGGSTQMISGDSTFANLRATGSAARTMEFAAGSMQTITGALTLSGASGQRLALRSSAPGSTWGLAPSGTRSCSYVDVQDGINTVGPLIGPSYSTDSGNTTLWFGNDRYWVGAGRPLDSLSTAPTAAYGVRKLRSAYAGTALRVRRSLDNAQQDIGFTSAGDLDVTALTTFVGANSGYVAVWYDQSGNGHDLARATNGEQPRIVAAGVVQTLNARTGIHFTHAQKLYSMPVGAPLAGSTVCSGTVVGSLVGSGFTYGRMISLQLDTDPADWFPSTSVALITQDGGGVGVQSYRAGLMATSAVPAFGTPFIATAVLSNGGADSNMWVNGVIGSPVTGLTPRALGGAVVISTGDFFTNTGTGLEGDESEIIVFPTALSTPDRQALETSQGAYFAIAGIVGPADTDNTWSESANWAYTSGGSGGASVPGSANAVYFDANGRALCLVDVAANASSLTMVSGYTGTLAFGTNTLTVAGSADLRSGGTFSGSTGDLALSTSGTLKPPTATTIPNLTVIGGTTTLATNNLSVAGNLTISGGNLTANGRAISVAGNWVNGVGTMGFTAGTGTVTLNGAGGSTQVISGDTIFDSLTATCTTARTLNFTAGDTQVVGGTLILNGASGQLLSLRSTASPSVWTLTPSGTRTCRYVDVQDGINTVGPAINPLGGVNTSNTTLWFGTDRYWVAGKPLPLDDVSVSPAAAYGLRHLRTAYAGPAIRVRRSSDNVESDIGFAGNGTLDSAALLAFAGVDSVFVTTWYDQSGNGRDAIQTSPSGQPRLVSSGTLDTQNGRPAVTFLGAQGMPTGLTNIQATGSGTDITVSTVFRADNGVSQNLLGDGSSATNRIVVHAPWSDGNTYFDVGNSTTGRFSGALAWPTLAVGTFRRAGSQGDVWQNGSLGFTTSGLSGGVGASQNICLGCQDSFLSNPMRGHLAELVIFPSGLSTADRQVLEDSQAGYFAISIADWSASANWSYTTGGAGGAPVPGAADAVYFDSGGISTCDLNVAANAASVAMVSGYTGALAFGTNTLTVVGSADLRSGGTFTGSTGGLVLNASGMLRPPAATTIPNLTVTTGTATLATNDLSVAGNLTISGGNLTANGRNISVAGNWANSGGTSGFTAGTGTVTLNGGGGSTQVISGNTTFSNLSAACTTARTLHFAAGSTQVVGSALSLNGAIGQLLSLRSTASPTVWNITASGTRSCSYVDVMDGVNTAAPAINPVHSTDSGNTLLWFVTDRYWVGGVQVPLDSLGTTAVAAYGLRHLTNTYAGPAVRVRRSSDNAEKDIGFASDGGLDIAALTSFTGTDSALVVAWYDQSGNGRHAYQATAGIQPRLVDAGTVELVGGKPAVRFITSALTRLTTTATNFIPTTNTSVTTVQLTATPAVYDTISIQANQRMHARIGSGTVWGGYSTSDSSAGTTLSPGTPYVLSTAMAGGGAIFRTGGTAVAGSNIGDVTQVALSLGADGSGLNRNLDGLIAEYIIFGAALAADDQQRIEDSQSVFFGVAYPGGSTWAWSSRDNWAFTSGGVGGAPVPTTLDAVYLDGNGRTGCTTDVAANAGSLTMVSGYNGALAFGTNTLTVAGSADLRSAGTFTGTTGGLALSATGTLTPPAATTIPNLTVTGGIVTVSANDLSVANNVSVSAGNLTANGRNVYLAGNWANSVGNGGFTPGSGTVIFNGLGGSTQILNGNTTFNNVTATGSLARTLEFTAGSTQTINGTLSLSGAAGQLLSLRSSVNASTWTVIPNGTRTCSYLDVQDGINTVAPAINPPFSSDSGNTTFWFPDRKYWIAAVTGRWGDANNWSQNSGGAGGVAPPTFTSDVYFDGNGLGDCLIDALADITVHAWTQSSGYNGTVLFGTTYQGALQSITISADAMVDGGSWSHPSNDHGRVHRLNVAIGGSLAVGAGGRIDVDARGYAAGGGFTTSSLVSLAAADSSSDRTVFVDDMQIVPADAPVVGDSGFEELYTGDYTYSPTGTTWTHDLGTGVQRNGGAFGGATSPEGQQTAFIQVNSTTPRTLSQTIVCASGTYRLRFRAARRSSGAGAIPSLVVQANGTAISGDLLPTGTQFEVMTTPAFSASGSTVVAFVLTMPSGTGDRSVFIDDVQIIPEGAPEFTNGSFETPVISDVGPLTGTGWSGIGSSALAHDSNIYGSPNGVAGTQCVLLQGAPAAIPGEITQALDIPNGTYRLRFLAAQRSGPYQTIQVSINGTPISGTVTPSSLSWDSYSTPTFTLSNPIGVNEGGAHGGRGGPGATGGPGGTAPTYGLPTAPIESGGGGSVASGTTPHGGGAVRLSVTGTATIAGVISAGGESAINSGGAGAGGSIWLTCATLLGNGAMTADGGASSGTAGTGGGGRIAIVLTSGSSFGALSTHAFGGVASGSGGSAAAGTVYLQTATQGVNHGTLIIDNNGVSTEAPVVTALNDAQFNTGAADNATVLVGAVTTAGNGRCLVGAGDTLSITGDGTTLTVNTGTSLVNQGTVNLGGTTFTVAGTYTSSATGAVTTYTGQADDATATPISTTYDTVGFANSGTTFQQVGAISANADLSIAAGTTLTGGGNPLTIAGNWSNAGAYVPGGSTVSFTGAGGSNQNISGNTNFYDLSASTSAARTLTFAAGSTQAIAGTLTLNGASGQLLALRSSAPGSAWSLDPQGARSCAYVDVRDGTNLRLPLILPTSSVDSGGTTWWFGQTLALSWDGATSGAIEGQTSPVSWNLGSLAAGEVRTSGSGPDVAQVFAVRNSGDQPAQITATASSTGWGIAPFAGYEQATVAIAPSATFTSLDSTTSPAGVVLQSSLPAGSSQPFRLRIGAPIATDQGGSAQTLTITLNASPPP